MIVYWKHTRKAGRSREARLVFLFPLDPGFLIVYADLMTPFIVRVHSTYRDLQEELIRERALRSLAHQREQIERDVAAAMRGRDRREHLTGMARRLANLTYPIDQARLKALAQFHEQKRAAMTAMLELLEEQQLSVRQLAGELGISKSSASNYRRELVSVGLLAA